MLKLDLIFQVFKELQQSVPVTRLRESMPAERVLITV